LPFARIGVIPARGVAMLGIRLFGEPLRSLTVIRVTILGALRPLHRIAIPADLVGHWQLLFG
jgi:hypothetical protein